MSGIVGQTLCAMKGHKWQYERQIFKRLKKENGEAKFVLHDGDICTKCGAKQSKPIEPGVK